MDKDLVGKKGSLSSLEMIWKRYIAITKPISVIGDVDWESGVKKRYLGHGMIFLYDSDAKVIPLSSFMAPSLRLRAPAFFSTNMARKKPIVPLCRHYSRDLKHHVIYQSQVLGLKSTEVAINLNIPV